VGVCVADVLVEDAVIVELKSVRRVLKAHEVPLVNYLTATRKDVGWIINFAESKVEIKRRVRALPES
jgi:GxxExxY protein